jgi:hypothetical protein
MLGLFLIWEWFVSFTHSTRSVQDERYARRELNVNSKLPKVFKQVHFLSAGRGGTKGNAAMSEES